MLGLCDANTKAVRMTDQCVDKPRHKRDKSDAGPHLFVDQSSAWHKSIFVNDLITEALVINF